MTLKNPVFSRSEADKPEMCCRQGANRTDRLRRCDTVKDGDISSWRRLRTMIHPGFITRKQPLAVAKFPHCVHNPSISPSYSQIVIGALLNSTLPGSNMFGTGIFGPRWSWITEIKRGIAW
jgi:hypothetical protein